MKFLRWKGILPFALISALIYVATVFFMDLYLKRLLIKQGTRLNGALVEVDGLSLSFFQSRLSIRGLRAADPAELMKNRLDLDRIVADFRFLPLLKKKFVIEEVSLDGVKWGTPRRKPGGIPAAWKKEWAEADQQPSLVGTELAKLQQEVKAQLPQLDLDRLGERFDPRSFIKVEELASYKLAAALPVEIGKIGDQWQGRGQGLLAEKKQKLAELRNQVEILDPRNLKDPAAVLQAIQTVQKLRDEIETQRRQLESLRQEAKETMNHGVSLVQQSRQGLEQDIAAARKKIGLGDFKLERLSETFFGLPTVQHYARYLHYYRLANSYLVKAKTNKKSAPPPQRARGRTIRFPVTDRTPTFLLAKAGFSADTRDNREVGEAYRGRYRALATSISSEPELLRDPAQFELSATLGSGHFREAKLTGAIDRRQPENRDRFTAQVRGVGLAGLTLGGSGVFPIPLKNGSSDWGLNVDLRGETIQADFNGDFQKLVYDFSSHPSDNYVVRILREVLQTIDGFRLTITLAGPLNDPALSIRSTFDEALKNGLQKVVMQKVAAAQAKLETYLRNELAGRIAQGQKMLEGKQQEILSALDGQLKQVGDLKAFAERRIKELKDKQLGTLKQQLPTDKINDQAKDLRRHLGF